MTQAIPGPRPLPLIGTAYTVNPKNLVQTATDLGNKYGEIYVQQIPGRAPLYIVGSYRIVDELSDEEKFKKVVHPAISAVRDFAGNGLFTAEQEDPEWDKAHRILMPAFNPVALKSMYDGMVDIADQLMLKWSRTRSDADVDVTSEFTRLTLDTIALCSFSFRFNSFYSEELHPFVDAMVDGLAESGKRAHALELQKKLNVLGERRFQKDIKTMEETVDFLIAERRANPSPEGEEDILDVMLSAKDPSTGEGLDDQNLRFQLVTFLIAGHETTSGMLSFTLYELIKNPEVLAKARAVVDDVLGDRFPQHSDLRNLGYIDQILRESLRKYPTVPGYAVTPYEPTVVGKGYLGEHGEGLTVNPGDTMFILLNKVHRDPKIWEDPDRFEPDRFSFEQAKEIPHNAWKPFGNGQRSCIGRAFALQEATMVLSLLVKHFDFEFSDPNYELSLVDGLTSKPEDLFVHVRPREGHKYTGMSDFETASSHEDTGDASGMESGDSIARAAADAEPNGQSLQILVGSNAGTSRNFARRLATFAAAQGFEISLLDLDDAVGQLSTEAPVLICTSSYEGLPTDNARSFVNWLSSSVDVDLSGVDYAVFGAGNSEWASTFQRIPTLIDEQLEALGANRIIDRGVADVRGDYVGSFETWSEELWHRISALTGVDIDTSVGGEEVTAEMVDDGRGEVLRSETNEGYVPGVVTKNVQLSTNSDGPVNHKFQIDIELPEGVTYRTGDYLEVLPRNPQSLVNRVLTRFGLKAEQRISLGGRSSFLPVDAPISVGELLGGYVELTIPAGRKQIRAMVDNCPCPPEKAALQAYLEEPAYTEEIQRKRRSVLDLLEATPSAQLSFADFLNMLQPLAPRRYSISSSAQRNPNVASLTYSRIASPAWSGAGTYEGVSTTWLASLREGAVVAVSVVDGNENFRGTEDVSEPMILVGAGTGIAPLRAFVEDVAHRAEEAGVTPGRSVLFYGCHGPESDFLYREDFDNWSHAVEVRPAFSRHPELHDQEDIHYIQDRLWHERADVLDMLRDGARIFVCGNADTLAPAVRETVTNIIAEDRGITKEQAAEVVAEMEREHFTYVADVFT